MHCAGAAASASGREVAHRVGGASNPCELSQAALTECHRGCTTGGLCNASTLARPSVSFSVGASGRGVERMSAPVHAVGNSNCAILSPAIQHCRKIEGV